MNKGAEVAGQTTTNPGQTPYDDRFYDDIEGGSLSSARVVAPLMMKLTEVHSVVDVGCGRGAWLKGFREAGVEVVRGFDGAYVDVDKLLIERDEFTRADLRDPVKVDRRYDLAICLEVGEHLPTPSSPGLVESLVAAAPVVMFSAAIPGQGGTYHINEQWPEFWEKLFAAKRYVRIDALRHQIWSDPRVAWWYRQNLYVYAPEPAASEIRRRAEAAGPTLPPDMEFVASRILDRHKSLTGLLGVSAVAASRAIRARFRSGRSGG